MTRKETLKVLLLTEGGATFGFGHLSRCVSLAQAFEHNGLDPEMIVYGDAQADTWLGTQSHRMVDWIRDFDAIAASLDNADIVIVDSYLAETDIYAHVSQKARCPVFLDDMQRLDYPPGCIVNGGMGAEEMSYRNHSAENCFLGSDFALMRKPFWESPVKTVRDEISEILLTFGGTDSRGMTQDVLRLVETLYPSWTKWVVLGKSFVHRRAVEELKTDYVYFVEGPGAAEMKDVMQRVDVAISSAGQTVNELARMGVPTIGISVADNQKRNAQAWANKKFLFYAGDSNDLSWSDEVTEDFQKIESFEVRQERSRLGQQLVDGQGALRLVDRLMQRIKG